MPHKKSSQAGLGTIGIFAIIIGVCVMLGIVMIALTSKNEGASGSDSTTFSEGDAEWAEYSSDTIKLKLKYPTTWNVEPRTSAACLNHTNTTALVPPKELVQKAKAALNVEDWRYEINIKQLGVPAAACTSGFENAQNLIISSLNTTDTLSAGSFKGRHLTMVGLGKGAQPNFGLLTANKYSNQSQLGENLRMKKDDTEYVFGLTFAPAEGADASVNLAVKPDEFKKTELYKLTKKILEEL